MKSYYGSMDAKIFVLGVPTNMACHNLCIDYKAPAGIEHLLGLGAKYCLRKTRLGEETIDTMMKRMRNNVRWKYIFRDEKEDNNYIPNLYIKSEREPDNASEKIERGMDNFEREVKMLRRRQRRIDVHPNVTPMQAGLMKRLTEDEQLAVVATDKKGAWYNGYQLFDKKRS